MPKFDFTQEEKQAQNRDTKKILEAIKKGKFDYTDRDIWLLIDSLHGYISLDPCDIEDKRYDRELSHLVVCFGKNYQKVLEAYQESLAEKTLKTLRSCRTIEEVEESDADIEVIEVLGPLRYFCKYR